MINNSDITDAQWDRVDQIRQQWLDRQTTPITLAECTRAVHAMYTMLNMKQPIVLLAPTPEHAHIWDAMMQLMKTSSMTSSMSRLMISHTKGR